jgi:hypothetical protein
VIVPLLILLTSAAVVAGPLFGIAVAPAHFALAALAGTGSVLAMLIKL